MVDMRKEFPSQTENRRQWILDTVRENQEVTRGILNCIEREQFDAARMILCDMHKQDRDAILQPNGILTESQIELLK